MEPFIDSVIKYVVYHGSTDSIRKFDSTFPDQAFPALYFSRTFEKAEEYTRSAKNQLKSNRTLPRYVYACFIDMREPLELPSRQTYFIDQKRVDLITSLGFDGLIGKDEK